jgi:hypothetical protein
LPTHPYEMMMKQGRITAQEFGGHGRWFLLEALSLHQLKVVSTGHDSCLDNASSFRKLDETMRGQVWESGSRFTDEDALYCSLSIHV